MEQKERNIPQEEQDIIEFMRAVNQTIEAAHPSVTGTSDGANLTLRWLFEQLKTDGILDQDKIYLIHEALTKVCQHDIHLHDGSICWTCGEFQE